jgi:hypothetical protein
MKLAAASSFLAIATMALAACATSSGNSGESYQRVMRDGRELYCRQEDVPGTKAQREVCVTAGELASSRKINADFQRSMGARPAPVDP